MSNEFFTPQSRNEAILQNICGANNVLQEPQSKIEKLLQAILCEDETIVDFTPESRAELLLYAILTHGEYDAETQSRNETILKAILTNGEYDALPQSRIEALLIEWLDQTHCVEKTVSGDVVSINDAVGAPVQALIAEIVPVQDLHGYDAPWAPGAGKNKIPYPYYTGDGTISGVVFSTASNGKITATGVTDGGVNYFLARDLTLPSGTYTVSILGTHTGLTLIARDPVNSVILGDIMPQETYTTFTLSETTSVRLYFNTSIVGLSVDISAYIQLEVGSSPTSYAPYSNIRPISGWTECNVTRTGKNLLNPAWLTQSISTRKRWAWTDGVKLKGGETYTFSCSNGYGNITLYFVNMDGSYAVQGVKKATYTPQSDTLIKFQAYRNEGIDNAVTFQLELGSAATAYEPYRGDTYTVSFGSAGTVYDGTVDVTTGTLTVTKANIASYAGETLPGAWISDRDVYAAGTTPTIGAQVVYELAEPIVYHLTPVEIRTLAGQNTIWADTGSVTVTYKAQRTAAALMMMAGRF